MQWGHRDKKIRITWHLLKEHRDFKTEDNCGLQRAKQCHAVLYTAHSHLQQKQKGLQVICLSRDNKPSMKSKHPQACSLRLYHSEKIERPPHTSTNVHILRCLHLISSSLQFITLPGASSVDIADTRMMECNDLCRGLHNSTETGNKWEELASREAIAQHIVRI